MHPFHWTLDLVFHFTVLSASLMDLVRFVISLTANATDDSNDDPLSQTANEAKDRDDPLSQWVDVLSGLSLTIGWVKVLHWFQFSMILGPLIISMKRVIKVGI